MAIDSLDLHRLTGAEREILALLASGHTAKSIATLTGRTETAIHERLREARRKTGVSSSRELARLLRHQENWDEKIGMAFSGTARAASTSLVGGHRRLILIGFAMTAMVTATGAILLSLSAPSTTSQTTSSPAADPLFDTVVDPSASTPQQLHKKLNDEKRDRVWAPKAEAALAAAYRPIAGLTPGLRIRCASTLCEVIGHSSVGGASAVSRTMRNLQGQRLISALTRTDLYSLSQSFSGREKTSFAFVAYWTSTQP